MYESYFEGGIVKSMNHTFTPKKNLGLGFIPTPKTQKIWV